MATENWRPTLPHVPADHPWQLDPPFTGKGRGAPFATPVPRTLDRNRLDIRLTDELQTQINDLTASLRVNATEVIRQAVSMLHQQRLGRVVVAAAPAPAPTLALPEPERPIDALRQATKARRELDALIAQTEREVRGG